MIYQFNRKDHKAMRLQKRAPVHPGRILLKHYVEPLNIKIVDLAANIGVSRKAVSAIVNEHKAVTSDMALRCPRLLGRPRSCG